MTGGSQLAVPTLACKAERPLEGSEPRATARPRARPPLLLDLLRRLRARGRRRAEGQAEPSALGHNRISPALLDRQLASPWHSPLPVDTLSAHRPYIGFVFPAAWPSPLRSFSLIFSPAGRDLSLSARADSAAACFLRVPLTCSPLRPERPAPRRCSVDARGVSTWRKKRRNVHCFSRASWPRLESWDILAQVVWGASSPRDGRWSSEVGRR